VEEIETVYETEIEAGRFADTPDLWAAIYTQKILPSASAKIGSLMGNLAHKLQLTGGGGPGEQASVEEAQRELSRLRARIEAAENPQSASGQSVLSSTNKRELHVRPLLEQKGWSTHDWAVHSNVDSHTAYDYLKGKTNPYASTRAKLAKSLEIDVTELTDDGC
jgi:hypothetical protein